MRKKQQKRQIHFHEGAMFYFCSQYKQVLHRLHQCGVSVEETIKIKYLKNSHRKSENCCKKASGVQILNDAHTDEKHNYFSTWNSTKESFLSK